MLIISLEAINYDIIEAEPASCLQICLKIITKIGRYRYYTERNNY